MHMWEKDPHSPVLFLCAFLQMCVAERKSFQYCNTRYVQLCLPVMKTESTIAFSMDLPPPEGAGEKRRWPWIRTRAVNSEVPPPAQAQNHSRRHGALNNPLTPALRGLQAHTGWLESAEPLQVSVGCAVPQRPQSRKKQTPCQGGLPFEIPVNLCLSQHRLLGKGDGMYKMKLKKERHTKCF